MKFAWGGGGETSRLLFGYHHLDPPPAISQVGSKQECSSFCHLSIVIMVLCETAVYYVSKASLRTTSPALCERELSAYNDRMMDSPSLKCVTGGRILHLSSFPKWLPKGHRGLLGNVQAFWLQLFSWNFQGLRSKMDFSREPLQLLQVASRWC